MSDIRGTIAWIQALMDDLIASTGTLITVPRPIRQPSNIQSKSLLRVHIFGNMKTLSDALFAGAARSIVTAVSAQQPPTANAAASHVVELQLVRLSNGQLVTDLTNSTVLNINDTTHSFTILAAVSSSELVRVSYRW
jgi:ribosomal protein S12